MKTESGLFVPSPLQSRILDHLRTKGRSDLHEITRGVDATVSGVQGSLKMLRDQGLVTKSGILFELAPCCKKSSTKKEG